MINQTTETTTIVSKLNELKNNLYTGKVEIATEKRGNWLFYFRLGRLIWCQGGENNQERWQRYLKYYCPQLKSADWEAIANEDQYQSLAELYERKLLGKDTITTIIKQIAEEVVFDLIQCSQSETLFPKETPNEIPKLLLGLVEVSSILEVAQNNWQSWQEKGLTQYSPNWYLLLKTKSAVNKKLANKIDGSQTLRGLAWQSKGNFLQLTDLILPFLEEGIITFSLYPEVKPPHNESQPSTHKKVIACIDDSAVVCEQLNSCLTALGYDVMTFQSPIEAISQLLKNPPDLILLDVMMPVINGYELCTQMRRAPKLKETPIVILTGKDGWVDKAKAKMCGATNFLSKPIERTKLLTTIDQYLNVSK